MSRKCWTTALGFLFVLIMRAIPAHAQTYTATELFGNSTSVSGYGLNASGQVVGLSFDNGATNLFDKQYYAGPAQATVWTGSTPTYLSSLPGLPNTFGTSINAAGQTAGLSCATNNTSCNAAIWNGTTPTSLGPVGTNGYVSGINDLGQVVGTIADSSGVDHATLWNGAVPTTLGTIPGGAQTYATSINNSGQIVGYTTIANSPSAEYDATLWSGNTITDLGLLGGKASLANAINNKGQAVGYFITGGSNSVIQAALWSGGVSKSLGTPGLNSEALAINDSGVVVGWGINPTTGTEDPMMWQNGKATDLSLYAAALSGSGTGQAIAINDNGQILIDDISGQIALLTPNPVPLPASAWLMLSAMVSMGVFARGRRCAVGATTSL